MIKTSTKDSLFKSYEDTFFAFRSRCEKDADIGEDLNYYLKGLMIVCREDTYYKELKNLILQYGLDVNRVLDVSPWRLFINSDELSGHEILDRVEALPGKPDLKRFVLRLIQKTGYPDEEDANYEAIMSVYADFANDPRGPFAGLDQQRIRSFSRSHLIPSNN